MTHSVIPFTDEQLRAAANLEQHYAAWVDAARQAGALPYGMRWKAVSGREYLYEILDREGNGKSLGRRSPETEAVHDAFRMKKEDLRERIEEAAARLADDARICRALRLPRLASQAAAILREADRRGILGSLVMVVGTNAMPAYAIEAGGRIGDAPDTTDDFDLAWIAEEADAEESALWATLHAVDPTFAVNTEKPFQARNRRAYEVEILAAPSRFHTMPRRDRPRPIALPEQEWLLRGKQVDHVVAAQDGSFARIIAPDPRWYALQKLWMSAQEKRNSLKRPKDRRQAMAVLNAVKAAMPHYPLDAAFEAELPPELLPCFREWQSNAG